MNGTFKIVVHVVEAKDLNSSVGVITNPVVHILFGNKKKKTQTRPPVKPTNIRFDETMEFPFVDGDNNDVITVRISDNRGFSRKVLGQCTINFREENLLSSINSEKEITKDLIIGKSEVIGKIKIRLKLSNGPVLKKTTKNTKNKNQKAKRLTSKQPSTSSTPLIFEYIRANNQNPGRLEEYLANATPDMVNACLPKNSNTALHEASIERDEAVLTMLLKFNEIQVNLKNSDDNTPLHYFCEKWNSPHFIEIFNLFLQQGADVNATNANGETPILKAIFNGSLRTLLMEALIHNNADVNITTKTSKESVLHYAVRLGRVDLINLILQARPKLDLRGEEGYTPQELAVEYKHTKIAAHLQQVRELFSWLDNNELHDYKAIFIKNDVTMTLLPDITDSFLQQMGIDSASVRIKIMKACENLEESVKNKSKKELENLYKKDDVIPSAYLDNLENTVRGMDGDSGGIIDERQLEYVKHLGTGASGDVYKGLFNDVPVAIKILREITYEQEINEFKIDFEVIRAVRHSVVRFYGASMKPHVCMVMEFCERGSLFDVLKDNALEIGWTKVFAFCKEICCGLQALHNNVPQILHRDLRTSNLLILPSNQVNQDWHIKLCDFGLHPAAPQGLRTATSENMMRGTLAYCDPEIYFGTAFSSASDIYSLGIIIWELVNRVIKGKYEKPYSENKGLRFDFQIIIRAAKDDLRPTLPVTTPQPFKDLIGRTLHKKQGERPTLPELMEVLEKIEECYKNDMLAWESIKLMQK